MEEGLSTRLFASLSSPVRFRILCLLQAYASLPYTEIMRKLGLDPARDAGKFAYHMRVLSEAGLIEQQPGGREYALTEVGRLAISLCRDVEEALRERHKLLVRTSRYAIEGFDRTKIAKALIREAGAPAHLASRIAEEAEKRLFRSRIKYLTAPLIREFVNALLLEEGLEEYRHKLTRLGMPVYDVKIRIDEASKRATPIEEVRVGAGTSVLEEYTLLAALPRDVADAHLDGLLHLVGIGSWIFKPNDVRCDLRTFLQYGLRTPYASPLPPPKSLRACFALLRLLALNAYRELERELVLPLFNTVLAPYAKGLESRRLAEELQLFLWELSATAGSTSLEISPTVPLHLRDEVAIGPCGKPVGCYGDFEKEVAEIFALLIREFERLSEKPLLNPSLVVALDEDAFTKAPDSLIATHKLAAANGTPYFASRREFASYSSFASRLDQSWRGDWELDTLRTGCLGQLAVNLPRLAWISQGDDERLTALLRKYLKMATQAFQIKRAEVAKRISECMLPLLASEARGEPYFRVKNASCELALLDLDQAMAMHTGSYMLESEQSLDFALGLLRHANALLRDISEREGIRLTISQTADYEALSRLKKLDADIFGPRTGEYLEYLVCLRKPNELPLSRELEAFAKLSQLSPGGALLTVEAGGRTPEDLLEVTKQAYKLNIPMLTFNVKLTYCALCEKTFKTSLLKCPSCKSSTVSHARRAGTKIVID